MARPASVALAGALALGLGALALAACGSGGDDDRADPSVAPTTGRAPLSSTPPPTAGAPGGPPRSPTDQVTPRTLTGTVGVAAGCLVLDTGAGRWALVGGALPPDLAAGTRVEITARPMPQAESPCGSPVLSVLTLTRL
jgi:hypothetical protein